MSDEKQPLVKLPGDEIDKAVAKVLNALAGNTAEGISSIAGDIFGGLIGDRVREWKTRNLLDTVGKTVKQITALGIDLQAARVLPNGELYALFDGASKAEDETLQDMWAGLLANSLNSQGTTFEISFAKTLEALSPNEAKILALLIELEEFEAVIWPNIRNLNNISSNPDNNVDMHKIKESKKKNLFNNLNIDIEFSEFSIQNLLRLGCLYEIPDSLSENSITQGDYGPLDADRIAAALTDLSHTIHNDGSHVLPLIGHFNNPNYNLTSYAKRLLGVCIPKQP